jgi:hypothetical protein
LEIYLDSRYTLRTVALLVPGLPCRPGTSEFASRRGAPAHIWGSEGLPPGGVWGEPPAGGQGGGAPLSGGLGGRSPPQKKNIRIIHSKGQVLLHNIHLIGIFIRIICLKSYKLLI